MFNRVKLLLPLGPVCCAMLAAPAHGQTLPIPGPETATAAAGAEALSAPAVAGATPPTPAAAPAPALLNGFWKGPLAVPGGSLEVIFRLMKLTSGEYFATLDVPLQKVSHMEVRVTQRADTVVLFAPAAGSRFTGRRTPDGQQLVGTWRQPGFQAPMALAFAAIPAPTAAPSAHLSRPYREEEVAFANPAAGPRLGGTFTVPAGAGPFPAVVLTSDAGPHDRDGSTDHFAPLGQLADYLTRRGVAVLRYDDRGVGRSAGPAAVSTAELVGDVQAGLGFLRARPEVDPARVGVIGHGEGGNVALLAAAQAGPPAFVVALAAYGLPGRVIVVQEEANTLKQAGTSPALAEAAVKRKQALVEIIRRTPDNGLAQASVANMLRQSDPALDEATARRRAADLTSVYYRNFLDFDPTAQLPAVACPVLLLNGTADLTVAADINPPLLLHGLRANKAVYAQKLPGINHQFQPERGQWPIVNGTPQPTFSPAAEEIIREWIVSQVK